MSTAPQIPPAGIETAATGRQLERAYAFAESAHKAYEAADETPYHSLAHTIVAAVAPILAPVPAPTAEPPVQRLHVAVDQTIPPSWLVQGCTIDRWTEPATRVRLSANMPCHDDQRVLIPLALVDGGEILVTCRSCATGYTVELVDEEDGGHRARFTITYHEVTLSRKKP
ncbi:MAG: hypothetical protein HOV87_11845 [Catenulispora sp.]|nr:hypothetical protein [Catenulispora sp.]NUT43929.1 hypothetical protein [Thermoactinospora sp.]